MGQEEVLKLLNKAEDWMTTKRIATKLKINRSTTSALLNRLKKQRMVKQRRKKDSKWHSEYEWSVR